jgi:hypothetical protein
MNTLLATALKSCFEKVAKSLPTLTAGSYPVDETVTIRIVGDVVKAEDEEYIPTVSIPYKKAFEMFLARMGFQRDNAMEALVQSMTDAINGVCPADVGLEAHINVDDVEKVVQAGLAAMPRKVRTGKTFVDCTVAVAPTPAMQVMVP